MRIKFLLMVMSVSMFLFIAASISPQETAEAAPLLQSLPSLEGVNIYFTETNGEASRFNQLEPGLSRFAGFLRRQGANLYTLEWRTRFPTDADMIVVAGPATDFSPDQTARLWAYMSNGGSLLLLANPVVETERGNAWLSNSGLFSLMWSDLNVRGRNDVVLTESMPLAEQEAESTAEPGASTNAPITRFSAANLSTDHPITQALTDPIAFFTARSIQFDSSLRDYNVVPLVTSDSEFYGENQYDEYLTTQLIAYNIGEESAGGDTARGPQTLAVAIENPANGMKVVLVGDRDIATNGNGFQTSPAGSASFLHPTNVQFMMNAAAWLLETELVEYTFPTPGPSATPTITPSPTLSPTPTPDVTFTPTPSS